jgi:hypothetical protein
VKQKRALKEKTQETNGKFNNIGSAHEKYINKYHCRAFIYKNYKKATS